MTLPTTPQQLLDIARPHFDEHGPNLTMTAFRRLTGVPRSRIVQHFGGWIALKSALGYPAVGAPRRQVTPGRTAESILNALRKILPDAGPGITLYEFTRRTRISATCVYLQFGSWSELRQQAGLSRWPPARRLFTDEQLLLDVRHVINLSGKDVTQESYSAFGRIGLHTLIRRFGSFSAALTAFAEYMDELYHRLPDENDRLNYIRSRMDPLGQIRPKQFPPPTGQAIASSRMSLPLREGEMEWSKFNRFEHKSTFDVSPSPK